LACEAIKLAARVNDAAPRLWNIIPQMNDFLRPQLENFCARRTSVLKESHLGFQNKLRRRNTMLIIPLTLIAGSISASVYMGFIWRPAEPKRVRLFFHDVNGTVTA
jgi:hypothetical protein